MFVADVYEKALARARLDLERVTERRNYLNKQIERLNQIIAGLTPLVQPQVRPPQRLSDSESLKKTVETVFQLSSKPLTPVEVREQTEELGYTWKNAENALNAIHVVLKRMVEKGDLERIEDPSGARYRLTLPF